MSDQRDQLPNDGSESVDEDMLFVVEDADDSSTRPSRGANAPRAAASARPKGPKTTSTRLPTGESRVIVGSRKPHNPIYGKIARHASWVLGVAILCALAPHAVTWLGSRHWSRLVHKVELAHTIPAPESDQGSDEGFDSG